jgi:hypothetical protein
MNLQRALEMIAARLPPGSDAFEDTHEVTIRVPIWVLRLIRKWISQQ